MQITLELPSGNARQLLINTVVQIMNTCALSGTHKISPNFNSKKFPQEFMKFFSWTDAEQSMLYIKVSLRDDAMVIDIEGMYFQQLLDALTRNVNVGILPAVVVSN
jgi:hypothetical protein